MPVKPDYCKCLVCFWTFDGLKTVLIRPVIYRARNFRLYIFLPWYDSVHPR